LSAISLSSQDSRGRPDILAPGEVSKKLFHVAPEGVAGPQSIDGSHASHARIDLLPIAIRSKMLRCSKWGGKMSDTMYQASQPEYRDRGSGMGRAAVSAWAIVAFAILVFVGMQALRSPGNVSPVQESLSGAVVPRHDPACAGPRVPNAAAGDQCFGLGTPLDRANLDAYANIGW
jgi:hypothetical protein